MDLENDAEWSLPLCERLASQIKAIDSPDQKSILYKIWFDLMDWMLMRRTPSFLTGQYGRRYDLFVDVMPSLCDPELSEALWSWVVGLAHDCGQDFTRRMHLRTDVFELILEGPYIWTDQDDMRRVLRVFALLNDKSLRWAVLDSYIHTGALDAKERFVSDTEKIAGWCRENGVAVPFMISEEILSALDVENQS